MKYAIALFTGFVLGVALLLAGQNAHDEAVQLGVPQDGHDEAPPAPDGHADVVVVAVDDLALPRRSGAGRDRFRSGTHRADRLG